MMVIQKQRVKNEVGATQTYTVIAYVPARTVLLTTTEYTTPALRLTSRYGRTRVSSAVVHALSDK